MARERENAGHLVLPFMPSPFSNGTIIQDNIVRKHCDMFRTGLQATITPLEIKLRHIFFGNSTNYVAYCLNGHFLANLIAAILCLGIQS